MQILAPWFSDVSAQLYSEIKVTFKQHLSTDSAAF